jgi:pilus assembly protein CpaF
MEALAALGGLTRSALHSQLAAAFQVVLHLRRTRTGARRLTDVAVFEPDGHTVRVTPHRGKLGALLLARGVTPPW